MRCARRLSPCARSYGGGARGGTSNRQVRDPPYPGSGVCMVTCHRRTVPPGSERDVRRTARIFLLRLEYHSNRTVWEVRAQRSSVWEESGGRSEGPVGCRLPEERKSEESANGSCTVAGQRLRGKLSTVQTQVDGRRWWMVDCKVNGRLYPLLTAPQTLVWRRPCETGLAFSLN